MEAKKAHVSARKRETVKKLDELMKKYSNIGLVDLTALPCAQLQKMRKQLADKMVIYTAKKRLIRIAIEKIKNEKKGIDLLEKEMKGIPGLIFTNESPFKIYKLIQKSKSRAFAKPGQVSPADLIIPAGPTQFGPGPVIGELGQLGIKTAIEGGKVAIKSDFTAAKKGAVINDKIAGLLAKFSIMPMEIWLSVVAIYENGAIFRSGVLAVDEAEYISNITKAASWAFNLSVEACYLTKQNIEIIVTNAFRNAKALAIEQGILEKEVVDQILAKASAQAFGLKNKYNI